jgi:hypothetical protein
MEAIGFHTTLGKRYSLCSKVAMSRPPGTSCGISYTIRATSEKRRMQQYHTSFEYMPSEQFPIGIRTH